MHRLLSLGDVNIKKEYEPKIILIRNKSFQTILQVKKFEHLLSKSSFSAVSSSRKKTSARTIQGVYAKSHILVLTLISEKPTFSWFPEIGNYIFCKLHLFSLK